MNYKCPKCSIDFIPGTKFCQTCGCNLELEFIEKPTCPKCRTTYPTNTKFCVNDGSKLVRPEDLIPKCVICNTAYSDDFKFCPRDGGEIKVILTIQSSQPIYPNNEHINIQNKKYPKASIGNRFLASLLDGVILMGLSIPTSIFFMIGIKKTERYYDKDEASVLFFFGLLFYIIPVFYNFIKDGFGQGQSWGKKALDLMVVNLENNSPCDKGKSFFRNFISFMVVLIPFIGWLIEPIMILATEDGRSLGDKAANTQVIDKKNFLN
jgi:uncharacterized RDD family membrane protein YckC